MAVVEDGEARVGERRRPADAQPRRLPGRRRAGRQPQEAAYLHGDGGARPPAAARAALRLARSAAVAEALPLELAPDADGGTSIVVSAGARALGHLLACSASSAGNAENGLGGRSVLRAVVGVPVGASLALCAALDAAGKRAGLRQLEPPPEPIAAATAR